LIVLHTTLAHSVLQPKCLGQQPIL